MKKLTDAEVLALENVLIEDNLKIMKITEELGTSGAGNTNTSGYTSENNHVYTLGFLDGRVISIFNPFEEFKCSCDERVGIAAVAGDILYLIVENCYSGERKVVTVEPGRCYGARTEVAYDTFGIYRLTPEE